MRCTGCGSELNGDGVCPVCEPKAITRRAPRSPSSRPVRGCPRCGYRGEGMPYFSRGLHAAALVGLAVFTTWMLAAPAFLYYFLRRDHLVCPRCGRGWGVHGERALLADRDAEEPLNVPLPSAGRERRRAAVGWLLLVVAALALVLGAVEGEIGAVIFGAVAAAAGGLSLRSASEARVARRAAILARLQLPVLRLAAESGGRLTVTRTASELGWTLPRAEKVLHSLDDGLRVSSEVTPEGVIEYEFRELLPRSR